MRLCSFSLAGSLFLMALVAFTSIAVGDEAVTATGETSAKTQSERIAAAREMMEVMGVMKQMETAVQSVKESFLKASERAPDNKKADFEKHFDASTKRLMDYRDEMTADFAKLYSKHFTVEEMKTVTEFYRSGPGAKFVSLMPKLMQEGAELGMKYSRKMLMEIKKSPIGADKGGD